MSKAPDEQDYNIEGAPLRINDLDIEALALWLHEKKIRTSQGKIIQPLHAGHKEVLADPARFKVLAAGRRFSKTLLSSLIAIAVLFQPRRRIFVVAPDYSLSEKVFREVYNILVRQLKIIEPGKQGKGKANNQKGNYYLETPWGSVLECKSAENPDSLAGEALDLVVVDEAALIENMDNIWAMMLRPTLIDKQGSALFISTPRGKNGFYKLFLQGQLGKKQREGLVQITRDTETGIDNDFTDWSSFQKTSYDNPLLAATPEKAKEEIDKAYREAVLSGKIIKFKQEYLADFEAVSDSCFSQFKAEATEHYPVSNIIDYKFDPNQGPIFAGCDFNYSKPASTIFAQVNKFNDVVIFDELFTPKTSTFIQGQMIAQKERELNKLANIYYKNNPQQIKQSVQFVDIVADISGDQRQLSGRTAWDDIEASYGKRPIGLKQDREIGCNMIRLWLQYPEFDIKGSVVMDENTKEHKTYPKLFINRNCTNLIYALSTASFKKTKAGSLKEDYEETPEGYEGLLDALRYLIVHLFHNTGEHFSLMGGF